MKVLRTNTPRDITLHDGEYPANLEPTDVVAHHEAGLRVAHRVHKGIQQRELRLKRLGFTTRARGRAPEPRAAPLS